MRITAFNETYEEFVAKFEPKKTTDDCYTPDYVFEAVKRWAFSEYGLAEGTEIVRPFWPGGNYELEEYPAGCVVLDNPPFSILSKITRHYDARGIKYFLFAPSLTCFNIPAPCHIAVGANVIYENGANVNTSFVTNLSKNVIETAPDLLREIRKAQQDARKEKQRAKYVYPDSVLTSANAATMCCAGVKLAIPTGRACFIDGLDEQRVQGKKAFGGAYLLSNEAERIRREAVENRQPIDGADPWEEPITWGLSWREQVMRKMMDGGTHATETGV